MKNQQMTDREAFYIAIHTLLSNGIRDLESNRDDKVQLAIKQIHAADTLVENELKFIEKMNKETKDEN